MTLIEFLLARISEDESVGHDWRHHPGKVEVHGGGAGYLAIANGQRVLAECEAKRWALSAWGDFRGEWTDAQAEAARCTREQYFRRMAQVYAHHPDYREEWRL